MYLFPTLNKATDKPLAVKYFAEARLPVDGMSDSKAKVRSNETKTSRD